MHEELNNFT
jgi:hypothetical protein